MKYHVIVDNEWYFTGTFEQCSDVMANIYADEEFFGSCYIVSDEKF